MGLTDRVYRIRVGKASGSGSQTVNLIRTRGRIDTSLTHQL